MASCGKTSYKISDLVHFTSAIIFSVNECDEHVECLYERMLLPLYDKCSCMHVLVQSILFQHFSNFMNAHVHGAGFPDG